MSTPLNRIQIVNLCMLELGRAQVVAATDDPWSTLIDQRVDSDLEYVIQEHQWNFANKYISIGTPDVSNPSPDWLYAFTLPSDFLNMRTPRNQLAYQIIGKQICVNSNYVQFYYTASTSDYSILPRYFQQVLVFYICSRVAKPLTQNIDLARDMDIAYVKELAKGKMQDIFLNPIYSSPNNPFDRGYGPSSQGGR